MLAHRTHALLRETDDYHNLTRTLLHLSDPGGVLYHAPLSSENTLQGTKRVFIDHEPQAGSWHHLILGAIRIHILSYSALLSDIQYD